MFKKFFKEKTITGYQLVLGLALTFFVSGLIFWVPIKADFHLTVKVPYESCIGT